MNRAETLEWLRELKSFKISFYHSINLNNKFWNKWKSIKSLSK